MSSASNIKPVSASLILSVPAHTPFIHIVLTRTVEFGCPLIELQGTRTTGVKCCGHRLQMLSSSQLRQRHSFYSIPEAQGSLFIQNTMNLEKIICNKGNKPTSHSKKLRHLPKTSVVHM